MRLVQSGLLAIVSIRTTSPLEQEPKSQFAFGLPASPFDAILTAPPPEFLCLTTRNNDSNHLPDDDGCEVERNIKNVTPAVALFPRSRRESVLMVLRR